jgi:hypothetical protein
MACKYYINGVESKLYTELYGYMDNTSAEKKTSNAVYKILKNNGIATKFRGSTYLNQANLQPSLWEISGIIKNYLYKNNPRNYLF